MHIDIVRLTVQVDKGKAVAVGIGLRCGVGIAVDSKAGLLKNLKVSALGIAHRERVDGTVGVGNGYRRQAGVDERRRTDALDRVGQGNVGQVGTLVKRVAADRGDRRRQLDGIRLLHIGENMFAQRGDALRYHNVVNLVRVICPRLCRAAAEITCRARAADGQRMGVAVIRPRAGAEAAAGAAGFCGIDLRRACRERQ